MSKSIAIVNDPVYTVDDSRIDVDGHSYYSAVADPSTSWSALTDPSTSWSSLSDPSTSWTELIK